MSWHTEKNLVTGQPELVWDGFENGIGDSPYTGISFMSGFNIKNFPKVGYSNIARTTATMSGGAPAEEVIRTLQDPSYLTNLYSVTLAGVVRQSTNAGATWTIVTAISGITEATGLFIWGAFLHVIGGDNSNHNANIYAIAINSTGTSGSWTTMTDNSGTSPIFNLTTQNISQNHYALYCNFDKRIYICNGNYIASLIPGINPTTGATTTYDPTTDTTYTWNEQALILNNVLQTGGSGTPASFLEQLQDKLLISQGNQILPWDRVSLEYDTPFPLSENIGKMININNIIYIFGGVPTYTGATGSSLVRSVVAGRGNIFYYNGFSGGYLRKLPDSINISNFVNEPEWYIGGLMSEQTKIYFGAIPNNGSPNSQGGIYSMDISSETQAIQYQTSPSPINIETTASRTYLYTALCTTQNRLINSNILNYSGGYINTNGTTYGYDFTAVDGSREQGDLTTDVIQVGTNLNPNTFNQVEVRFRNPLAVGETVLVEARNYFDGAVGSNESFTYTAPANSTDLSFVCPVIMQANEELAIRLVTTPIGDGSGGTAVPIKQIRLISNAK